MKKFFVKIIKLFRFNTAFKYAIELMLMVGLLALLLAVATQDVTGGIIETIIGFLLSAMLLYAARIFINHFEDLLKINYDTESLLRLYHGDARYRKRLQLGDTSVEFAYADNLINRGYRFEVVDDKDKMFEPDDFIMSNYEALFSAHTGSAKTNGITVRLDRFELKDGLCTFYLSRSTYFNHLLTNRAMDFGLFEGISLRDVYEYGPLLSPLEKSKMSNHIGINALVFLSDGNLLLPRRKKDSTISKNKVTSSIAVKLNFPTDGRQEIDAHHLLYGNIIDNLSARTKIRPEDLSEADIEVEFLGFGQNIYEGGKPQLYYAVHLTAIDSERYLTMPKLGDNGTRLDVDKCIYVVRPQSFRIERGLLAFEAVQPHGKQKRLRLGYEMSYLCNLWHYEQSRLPQAEDAAERTSESLV